MIKPIFLAATILVAAPAAADLPASYYSISYEAIAYNVDTGVVTHDASGVYAGPTTVADPFLAMTAGPTPTPFIAVTARGANGVYAAGGGSIEYYFAVAGPAPVVVPLRAHIVIDATAGSGAFDYGGGGVDIDTDQGSVSRSASVDHGGSVDPSMMIPHARVDEWVPFTATANLDDEDSILISGGATVEAGRRSNGYTRVFIDPVIAIDPTWAAANKGYSLGFSTGIGNAPGAGVVPEPASWALLAGGFAVVGASARRRRAVVAA